MKFEFNNQQYAEFLNSVAATDTYTLHATLSGAEPGNAVAVNTRAVDLECVWRTKDPSRAPTSSTPRGLPVSQFRAVAN